MTSTIKVGSKANLTELLANALQRLLDHLKEAAFFSAKDLDSVGRNLDRMQDTLRREDQSYSPHLLTLLENRISGCRKTLLELRSLLANLSPALAPIHERLVSILRSVAAANTRRKVFFILLSTAIPN